MAESMIRARFTNLLVYCACFAAAIGPTVSGGLAQEGTSPRLSFELASVRQNLSGADGRGPNTPYVNFPIGSDDAFSNTGGVFRAKNMPLVSFLIFAYKMDTNNRQALIDSLPDWAKVEQYDIEARTDLETVTKDQMREMMRSLLIERFGLSTREEERTIKVYKAILSRPGELGPQLREHPRDAVCPAELPNQAPQSRIAAPQVLIDSAGFPNVCGRFVNAMHSEKPHHRRFGGGGLSVGRIVSSFSGVGGLDKPVVDGTRLAGTYDFSLDFLPVSDAAPPADAEGPEFLEAVKKQLGLILVADKASMRFIVVDHINHPTDN